MGARHGTCRTCCTAPTWRPGDFVRWAKQVIDLLDQLAKVPGAGTLPSAALCIQAIDTVRRGVVAYSAVAE